MTDIEAKALALVREVLAERNLSDKRAVRREVSPYTEALCRAIEQHEAFKQEVSDAVVDYFGEHLVAEDGGDTLASFIIPKPDPLVDAMKDIGIGVYDNIKTEYADTLRDDLVRRFRAALDARGLEIREKGQ
jgi:hypothetical protein